MKPRWPTLDKLHAEERHGTPLLPCGCVDLGAPAGVRAVLRSALRFVALEPTGADRLKREPLGWRLIHRDGGSVFFAGVRHVPHDRFVVGIHLMDDVRHAIAAVHASVWRHVPDKPRY